MVDHKLETVFIINLYILTRFLLISLPHRSTLFRRPTWPSLHLPKYPISTHFSSWISPCRVAYHFSIHPHRSCHLWKWTLRNPPFYRFCTRPRTFFHRAKWKFLGLPFCCSSTPPRRPGRLTRHTCRSRGCCSSRNRPHSNCRPPRETFPFRVFYRYDILPCRQPSRAMFPHHSRAVCPPSNRLRTWLHKRNSKSLNRSNKYLCLRLCRWATLLYKHHHLHE